MDGQWVGSSSGTNPGIMVLDLEAHESGYAGHAFLFEDDPQMPGVLASVVLPSIEADQEVDLPLSPLWPGGGLMSRQELAAFAPDVSFPETASVRIVQKNNELHVTWSTPVGTAGSATLVGSQADQPSYLVPLEDVTTWSSFKELVLAMQPREHIFRGQPSPSRLRSSFHRTWRKDLIRYINSDVPAVRQAVSGQLRHLFRPDDPVENSAFWNLLQHHGYPTPMLDWSYSPFVAAYFAFRSFRRSPEHGEVVRIFMLDGTAWVKDQITSPNATFTRPHLTVLEALALQNPRALPQQGVSTVTNVDDIETFVWAREQTANRSYLRCVDLPFAERHTVLSELALMGITAASLFPGLDGACEEVKARNFGYNV